MAARLKLGPDLAIGVLGALALATITHYGWLGRYGPSGLIEVAAVVLYAWSVWLAVKNSVWTWPTGIIATALYLYLFIEWRLYADAGLQAVYIGFSFAGLFAWARGNVDATDDGAVERAGIVTLLTVIAAVAVGTIIVREYLIEVNGAAPLWDALLTSGSLGACYLLIRRRIETWVFWIALDCMYVALFISRDVFLTAALYLVLLGMAVIGLIDWRHRLRRQNEERW